jgi:hypothetical protein
MKVRPYLFSLTNNLDSLLAAFIGFILIQIFASHSGIGVSPDSVTYLSSANHLLAGQGFKSFDNLPTSDFPFAYPFFLTVISFVSGLDPLQFGQILNGILFGGLLYTCGGIMNGFIKPSDWYKRIMLFCILLSPALLEVYSYLWSETIFLLLILLFIAAISNYLRLKDNKWLFITTGICALACVTRYAGVFLIPTGLLLIYSNPGISLRKRIRDCTFFGILSVSLLVVNIIRNYFVIGLATGIRPKNQTGFVSIVKYFGEVFCDWVGINRAPAPAIFLTVAVVTVFTATVFYTVRRKRISFGFEYVIATTGLINCLFMLISYSLTRYEQFTSRLLSPLYILLLLSLTWWIPGWLEMGSRKMKWIAGIPALLLTAWFLNIQLAADWEYYDGVKDAGIPGYREDPFVQTEIVQWLKNNKKDFDPAAPVYSNAGDAFYFVTGLPALQLPFTDFPDKLASYYSGKNKSGHEYLVWFNNEENLQMPDLTTILKHKDLVLVKQVGDGAVYTSR